MLCRLTWRFHVLVLFCIPGMYGLCQFPNFTQNKVGNRQDFWNRNIRINGSFSVVRIENSTITETDYFQQQSTRRIQCMTSVVNSTDLFIVKGTSGSYCLQIIQRNANLIQFKTGNVISNKSCDQSQMKTDPWPLIASLPRHKTWVFCPESGGMDFRVKDMSSNLTVCDNFILHSRMSSECIKGEGIRLQFPDPTCIPSHTGWSQDQTLYCLATWTDGNYSYSVINWQGHDDPYCIRQDKALPGNAYVFQDFTCPTELPLPSDKIRYLKFSMNKTDNGECKDDTELCRNMTALGACNNDILSQYCRKTCGFCDVPTSCNLSKSLLGSWQQHDIRIASPSFVNITKNNISIDGFSTFTCVESVYNHMYALSTQFSNGCRQRYTCAEFGNVSPAVLLYRLSQSRLTYNSSQKFDLCDERQFRNDPDPLADRYRSQHMKNLVSTDSQILDKTVQCGLHGNFTLNGDPSTVNCTGRLSDNSNCADHNELTVKCGNVTTEFKCLSSFQPRPFGSQLLLTQINNTYFNCWVVSESGDALALMQDIQCHAGTDFDIASGRVAPSATFKLKPETNLCLNNGTTPHTTHSTATTPKTTNGNKTTATTHTVPTSTIVSNSTVGPAVTHGMSPGAVAGTIIGVLIFVAALTVCCIFISRRSRMPKFQHQPYGVL